MLDKLKNRVGTIWVGWNGNDKVDRRMDCGLFFSVLNRFMR